MLEVVYPDESFFFPAHFIIGIITTAIFLTVLLITKPILGEKQELA
jgi:hypothetical protein